MVVVLGLYLIALPIIPAVQFWWQKSRGFKPAAYTVTALNNQTVPAELIPADNRLVIPAIGLDEAIKEGNSLAAADSGVWRLPHSSQPADGSNTVLAGHRFSYSPSVARPFYNLDKVNQGDEIVVFWQKQLYRYRVIQKLVVTPEQTSIEAPTIDNRLTLYTCTPLWTSQNRLVIIAILEPRDE